MAIPLVAVEDIVAAKNNDSIVDAGAQARVAARMFNTKPPPQAP
ncbi:hypothetical protein [Desulfosoma caldarium]|uniref:Uncharacterized protein n=1 Tax=Desulfosoma caldarium TaxID=610254 RepID=A0A3N1ULT3_9BACT|nr:hypothetical protein [Desulfosoma caldarium]ROQ92182.1 hypothetical protein EDC27_1871 [Desulfosoma caldarium]